MVTEVRRFRSDQGLRPAQRVAGPADGLGDAGIAAHEPLIRSLARLDAPGDELHGHRDACRAPAASRVELDTRGAIDVAAERARLTKDRAAAEKEVAQAGAKLDNAGVRRQGARAGGRQDPGPAGRGRGRPRAGSTRALAALPLVTDRTDRLAGTRPGDGEYAAVEAELPARGFTRMALRPATASTTLLDLLGSPQRAYPAIHLTGTNGKTSTARMIDALLRALRPAHRPLHQPAPGDRHASGSASTASRSAEERFVATTTRSRRTPSWSTQRADDPLTFFEMITAHGVRGLRRRPGRRRRGRGRAGRRVRTPPT